MAFHQDLIKLPARAPARPVGNGLEEGDQKVVIRVITWDYEKKRWLMISRTVTDWVLRWSEQGRERFHRDPNKRTCDD